MSVKSAIHTTTMDVFDRDNYIFVSFEQGSRGHTLGRVLCALPNVHWYSNTDNGKCPWNVSGGWDPLFKERFVASRHFNRVMPNGVMLPPTHDYVREWIPDPSEYYTKHFAKQYLLAGALNMEKDLLFCTHDMPENLLEVFPNSRVINVVADVEWTVNRYMQTTALFPGWRKHDWIQGMQTAYGQYLSKVGASLGWYYTNQDLWEYTNSGSYREYVHDQIEKNMRQRNSVSDERVLTVTGREYKQIKDFLNDRRK